MEAYILFDKEDGLFRQSSTQDNSKTGKITFMPFMVIGKEMPLKLPQAANTGCLQLIQECRMFKMMNNKFNRNSLPRENFSFSRQGRFLSSKEVQGGLLKPPWQTNSSAVMSEGLFLPSGVPPSYSGRANRQALPHFNIVVKYG